MLADLLKIPSTSRANIKKKPINIGLVNTFLWGKGCIPEEEELQKGCNRIVKINHSQCTGMGKVPLPVALNMC